MPVLVYISIHGHSSDFPVVVTTTWVVPTTE